MTMEEIRKIDATFNVSVGTINAHISLMNSSENIWRSALQQIKFECVGGLLRIISTNGQVMLVTETHTTGGKSSDFEFAVKHLGKVNKKFAMCNSFEVMFAVKDGLISTGDLIARIGTGDGYPAWRAVIPGSYEPETAWRVLCPKRYAFAIKVVGDENMLPKRGHGTEGGPVFFQSEKLGETNTVAVMPFHCK